MQETKVIIRNFSVLLLQEIIYIIFVTSYELELIVVIRKFEITRFDRRSDTKKPSFRVNRSKRILLRILYDNYLYLYVYVHFIIILGIYSYVNLELVR